MEGARLALTTAAFDQFNGTIKAAILSADPDEALALAQVMLETNRRIYQARRQQ